MTITHSTTAGVAATAIATAVMIFMHAIVSVNTAQTGRIYRPDAEITTTTTATTWTKTLFDLSRNPVIAQLHQQQQQLSSKNSTTKTETEKPTHSASPPSSAHTSQTKTMRQPITTRTTATAADGSATLLGDCKSLTAPWGDVDPNIFYICDTQTKKPLQLRCPEGRGFFLGLGFSGCIPYEQWPACISNGRLEQVVICDSEHMQQPWETLNPNKFYVCLQETIEPSVLNCEPGKGFVHAIVAASGADSGGSSSTSATRHGATGVSVGNGGFSEIVGCANWEKWRMYMHCTDYY